jgi:spermidine synthase
MLQRAATLGVGWAVIPLALLVLLVRWQRRWAVPFVIAGIGAAEMTLEVVILFAFQVFRGTLYAEVGLIVTAFMAGLALGGCVGNGMLARRGRRQEAGETRRADSEHTSLSPPLGHASSRRDWARRALIVLEIGMVAGAGLLSLLLSLGIPAPQVTFPVLAMMAGGLTGMAFPRALAMTSGRRDRVVGLLYGADLLGGCLGALLGSVFLVPVLGIPATCVAIGLVGLAGALALA